MLFLPFSYPSFCCQTGGNFLARNNVFKFLSLMRNFLFKFTALLAAMPLSAATHTSVPAAESRPHPCMMESLPNDALCAIYPVWENRERKAGRKIGLRIVILPAPGQEKAPDPLFVFAGGPGQPASDMVPGWASLQSLQPLRARRDIVFIDQRGTGGSKPRRVKKLIRVFANALKARDLQLFRSFCFFPYIFVIKRR